MQHSFDLKPYNLKRPERVRWYFPESAKTIIDEFKSKGLRKFAAQSQELLIANNIEFHYKILNKTDFLDWLPYYISNMMIHEFEIIASEEWFDKSTTQGNVIAGLFFYQNQKMIGSGIFTLKGNERAAFAFKASDRIELSNKPNSSLGAAIDYLFLKIMKEKNIATISGGRSKNVFGVINTFGYLEYKLRFGYQPVADPDSPQFSSVPLNSEGLAAFYALKENLLALFLLKPIGHPYTLEAARYASPELPFLELTY